MTRFKCRATRNYFRAADYDLPERYFNLPVTLFTLQKFAVIRFKNLDLRIQFNTSVSELKTFDLTIDILDSFFVVMNSWSSAFVALICAGGFLALAS